MKVVKRDGSLVEYDRARIERAIGKALGETDESIEWGKYEEMIGEIERNISDGMNVEEVSDIVESQMFVFGIPKSAKRYLLYREEHRKRREQGWEMTDLQRDIYENKYRNENETFNEFLERVSGGNQKIKKLIRDKKFLFGGRTLANRGVDNGASFSNCYTEGRVGDSLEEIMDTAKNLALTYKHQGGEGLSLTNIRPKGMPIGNSGFVSDGFIPFMKIFDTTTSAISQGGARKGALLMACDVEHKDIMDFIKIKSDTNEITKANLSVEISDDFMDAVEKYYTKGETVTLHIKKEYGGHPIEYDIVPIDIYKEIIKHAYEYADPGVIFTRRFKNYNLMEYIDSYNIEASNACGEQPMKKAISCNLSSINLAEYIKNNKFDFKSFKEDIHIIVEAMDDIVEEGKDRHALPLQREEIAKYRNIGIGFMGLGTLFIKLGIKYGSNESKELLDMIMNVMFREAVFASSNLAVKRGSFPEYNDSVFRAEIVQKHFSQDEIKKLMSQGIRNASLLSIAPTGSIGTMFGVTTGIEPEFAFKYRRKTESLHGNEDKYYDVYVPIAKEYMEENNTNVLPDYFVSSENVHWRDRIEMQAIAQEHVDTAISSTVNLPKGTSLDSVEHLYLYAWKRGLKGVTIFYSGGKKAGILTTGNDVTNKPEGEMTPKEIEDKIIELQMLKYDKAHEKYKEDSDSCPICGGFLKHENSCHECISCGWSPCGL